MLLLLTQAACRRDPLQGRLPSDGSEANAFAKHASPSDLIVVNPNQTSTPYDQLSFKIQNQFYIV